MLDCLLFFSHGKREISRYISIPEGNYVLQVSRIKNKYIEKDLSLLTLQHLK